MTTTEPDPAPTSGVVETDDTAPSMPTSAPVKARHRRNRTRRIVSGPPRWLFVTTAVIALAGVIGTIAFYLDWSNLSNQNNAEAAATATARVFLVHLTNFNAKDIDADFNSVQALATGDFASQAQTFFSSSIRQELENALAESRGQIRNLEVQSFDGSQATIYGVIDQLFVNNKISSPQSDVVRLVVTMADTSKGWRVSAVTVLSGPSAISPSSPGTGTN